VFAALSERLQNIFNKIRGRGKLSEAEVKQAMREIRLALLEADVNYKVVKDFVDKVSQRAVGKEVLESLTPAQQVVKIVYEEMTNLLGSTDSKLIFASQPPTTIMLIGLQGSGKTTACVKLAYLVRSQGRNPVMIAADIYRPAAVEQLVTLGKENHIEVFTSSNRPEQIVKSGLAEAKKRGHDVVIIDTAGRLQVDEEMMNEVVRLKQIASPHQVLLVVDAMTGQEAVNVATVFEDRLGFDGLILTKLDGDARGGAALSIRSVTGKPIKFASFGEKVNSLEVFHPDRLASRILGMGDVLGLIEKAQATADAKKAKELEEKILKAQITLDDFLDQLKQLKKMGPIGQIIKMLPGASNSALKGVNISDSDIIRVQAIIESMTRAERLNPNILNGSRRARIARGSGTTVAEVNKVLKQFHQTKKMMKAISSGKMGKLKLPFF
jgi:signal recognition particle subunit SRP54